METNVCNSGPELRKKKGCQLNLVISPLGHTLDREKASFSILAMCGVKRNAFIIEGYVSVKTV